MTLASMLGTLAGGIGLFLLGMTMMSDGLKLAAGPALERVLAGATRTRWHGLGSGVLVTAVVQSSSAVTVATIGFVNAGLLGLGGALWVLFGANVGTTMTGWIVALVGLKFKVEALALPLVGLGVVLRLAADGRRLGAAGSALAGFGLLFLGIGLLQQGFAGVAGQVQVPTGTGPSAVLAQLAVGLVLTVLMQSSSAAMTVTLTAAQGGLVDAQGAAAVVIGANLGTTVTAVLAALGATANARRAAAAHVVFNLVTGVVALLLLPWLIGAIAAGARLLELPPEPAAKLALFHTVFNVLGVLLMLPLAAPLTRFLQRRFHAQAEDDSRLQFLDDTVLAVPALAVDALGAEINRLGGHAGLALQRAASPADAAATAREAQLVETLAPQVGQFVERLNRSAMGPLSSARLAALLQALRGHESAATLARAAAVETAGNAASPALSLDTTTAHPPERAALVALQTGFDQAVRAAVASPDAEAGLPAAVESRYAELKRALLRAGADGSLSVTAMDQAMDRASALNRGLQQWRGARAAEQAARPAR